MTEPGDVQIKADSRNQATGDRMVTVLLTRFPYTLLQELATHRLLRQGGVVEVLGDTNPFTEVTSRSSGSSRAIPVERVIQRILADPFIPQFSQQQKGMQGIEIDDPEFQKNNEHLWRNALEQNIDLARKLAEQGVHKQHVNDLLKPFMRIPILITATEWENFFYLRTDKPCRPEFRAWAIAIRDTITQSTPTELHPGEWHIPFGDQMPADLSLREQLQVATARCARLSYATHSGNRDVQEDLRLHDQLLQDGHMGPLEHSAMAVENYLTTPQKIPCYALLPSQTTPVFTRNLRGFYSYRALVEDQGLIVNSSE
ncbi:hypothetical protein GlitD10_1374 [Gloeomargarita lithophora Alchichica-D10]|uniref:Uncharacterized protein n=1 Tax=Gloeomargarita lithophora Alchichica-D10 TaxID=1188229 RepID=A0A1J0ACQ0_9CYAN|nr:FAD-dependent thymidylate synthase [Gloeomargarita lithophora]APB33695.1 hypothetical protein GlitD10_1374 [Gloeomargarita lithophora Alchichica-D10]